MFQDAVRRAMGFTQPVIISTLYDSGEVQCGIGAFIILNSDGWVLTCNHIFDVRRQAHQDAQDIAEKDKKESEIRDNTRLSLSQRRKHISKLRINRKLIKNHSYWWGQDTARAAVVHTNPLADLALAQLTGFDMSKVPSFPILGNPANHIHPGAFLCKLGYPFWEIKASWDAATGAFALPADTIPPPFFPLEGMYTRDCIVVDEKSNTFARYLETSSPGLRGQSGGPTFDQSGVVWAVQSHTRTLDVGFDAKILRNGREVTEHQAMSVGFGADIEEIMKLLNAHQITTQIQP